MANCDFESYVLKPSSCLEKDSTGSFIIKKKTVLLSILLSVPAANLADGIPGDMSNQWKASQSLFAIAEQQWKTL